MSVVFEARHAELGKRVAVKVMHRALCEPDGASVKRLLREGRAATAIHHPNVVSVLDVGVEGDTPYLVMELLEGEDLSQRLAREAPLSVEASLDVVLPLLAGVIAVHEAGIVHGDLKPSNVFLARRHRRVEPVLVDFGISKPIAPSPHTSATGSRRAPGTLNYMASELARGAGRADPKSDQYALAVILYECLTGGTPFWGADDYELLCAIVTGAVVPPSTLHPEVPTGLDAVVLRALERDPAARFPDVRALAAALLPFAPETTRRAFELEFADAATMETFTRTAPSLRPPSRPGPRVLVSSLLGIAAAAGLVGASWSTRAPPPASAPSAPAVRAPSPDLRASPSAVASASPTRDTPPESPPAAPEPRPPRHAPSARPAPSAHPARAPHPSAPPVERGSNDVPILEVP